MPSTISDIFRFMEKLSENAENRTIEDIQKQIRKTKKLVQTLVLEKERVPEHLVTCRRCKRRGHWTLSCRAYKDIYGKSLDYDSD